MHRFSLSSDYDDDFEIIESETDFEGNSLITIVNVLLLCCYIIVLYCSCVVILLTLLEHRTGKFAFTSCCGYYLEFPVVV